MKLETRIYLHQKTCAARYSTSWVKKILRLYQQNLLSFGVWVRSP